MTQPTHSPLFFKTSTLLQLLTSTQAPNTALATLKATFSSPLSIARLLVNLATQPFPEHKVHIRKSSDWEKMPGYWVAPFVGELDEERLGDWERDGDAEGEGFMTMVFFHGGAFSVGHALMYTSFMTSLILNSQTKIRILTIEYNLPSNPPSTFTYPYQQNLLFSICQHLLSLGIPAGKLVIGGDSSGAFNTLKCFEMLCDAGVEGLGGLFLVSPLLDLWVPENKEEEIEMFGENNSLALNQTTDYVAPSFLLSGLKAYQPPLECAPSHTLGKYIERMPPTFVSYGTGEILLDTIVGFEEKLKGRGVDVTVFAGEGESHVFNVLEEKYSRCLEIRRESVRSAGAWFEGLGGEGK